MFNNNNLNDILKDITVVNKWFNPQTKQNEYKLSYVKGFWSSNEGIDISNVELVKSDGLKVFVFDLTGYVEPRKFQETGTGWTLQNDDYLVKGIIKKITTLADLKANYECMKITNVANKDYGSLDMQHFEISGE